MDLSLLSGLLNGVLMPVMGLVLIPRALREQETGIYMGFKDVRLLYYAVLIVGLQMFLILPRFGFSIEAAARLLFVTGFPFLFAIGFIKLADGFGLRIDYQIRRPDQII